MKLTKEEINTIADYLQKNKDMIVCKDLEKFYDKLIADMGWLYAGKVTQRFLDRGIYAQELISWFTDHIPEGCFYNTNIGPSITIPGNIKIIDSDAFACCKNLKEIIIEEGVEEIGESAFEYCTNLKVVYFPDSIKEVGAILFGDGYGFDMEPVIKCHKGSYIERIFTDPGYDDIEDGPLFKVEII